MTARKQMIHPALKRRIGRVADRLPSGDQTIGTIARPVLDAHERIPGCRPQCSATQPGADPASPGATCRHGQAHRQHRALAVFDRAIGQTETRAQLVQIGFQFLARQAA